MTRPTIDRADAVHGASRRASPAPASTEGDSDPSRAPSRRGKRGVLIHVEPEMLRRLKHLATDRDTTLQALGVEALERLLAGR